MRFLVCSAVLVLTMGAFGAPDHGRAETQVADTRHSDTCRTYENRARFLPRLGPVTFPVAMAEACAAARASLAAGNDDERRTAQLFLDRLSVLRDLVIEMNMRRTYGADASPFSTPTRQHGRAVGFYSVSETGEFLIAQRIGVIAAFRDWRDQTQSFGVAFVD